MTSFFKGERSWWDSKRNEYLCWSKPSERFSKKMLWEISQNSQENICAGISFLVFSCEFCQICNNAFFYRRVPNLCFQRSSEQKPVRLSAIYTRFSWKSLQKKECECCEILKNTYFAKIFLLLLFHNTHQMRYYHFFIDVIISLRLLLKVWIWYICQNRIDNCYHHDGEQLGFCKKIHIKTQSRIFL